jgi:beta-N-acetylhexosaminidase
MRIVGILIISLMTSVNVIGQQHPGTADSLDIKIGQMIMVGFNGKEVAANDPILTEIAGGMVGGVILFEKNIADSNSYIHLKQLTYALKAPAPIPLIMAIDQEGGKVNRLKTKYKFPKSVTAEYLGRIDNPDSTRFYAEITAATLSGLGFNVNFTPVLDLAANPDNPIIAKPGRAYSADPLKVAEHAGITIKAHDHVKVLTVGKHFPGHGSSRADTHKGMADVTNTWDKSELVPYATLIETNTLPAIMSAHIVNSNLDPSGLPGTLSQPILQGILRDQLKFSGVIFSDDMQMHAITKYYGLETAIEKGINAGLDVLIFSNNIQESKDRTVAHVHQIIKDMVTSGKIPMSRINESYARILKMKQAYFYE